MDKRQELISTYFTRFAGQARHTLRELIDMDIDQLASWALRD